VPDQVVGNYYCTLTISSAEAVNSPVFLDITLRVVEPLTVPAQFDTIQAAVDAAGYRDIVLVADGTYTGEGNVEVSFRGKAINLRSENGPDNCIIDCQGLNRGFKFVTNEGPDSILNGFTIVNGLMPYGGGVKVGNYCGPRILNCIIKDCTAEIDGGGIYCGNNSSATIQACQIINNTSGDFAGGIYTDETSSVRINNCDIINNSAYSQGGGIYAMYGTVDIRHCRIVNNTASNGGGMYLNENSQINITNCSVEDNVAAGNGGGIRLRFGTSATFTNCLFRNNTAGIKGGGIRLNEYPADYTKFSVVNCTFADNHAEQGGGLWGNGVAVFNSIFVNNNNSAIIAEDEYGCTINYCHFYNNPGSDYNGRTGADQINDMPGNSNNLDGNPLLSSDLHLLPGSPCIDAGDNDAITEVTDLDGNLRIINGIVDIGAYENLHYVEPFIALSAYNFTFSAPEEGTNPENQILEIGNWGENELHWSITESCDWLTVTPDSGSSTGQL
jgi:parallel beta-helix repeat protein